MVMGYQMLVCFTKSSFPSILLARTWSWMKQRHEKKNHIFNHTLKLDLTHFLIFQNLSFNVTEHNFNSHRLKVFGKNYKSALAKKFMHKWFWKESMSAFSNIETIHVSIKHSFNNNHQHGRIICIVSWPPYTKYQNAVVHIVDCVLIVVS